MHILLIHQAFVALDEPGGTRHHELACHLAERGHRVTVVASSVSYLTGKRTPTPPQPAPYKGGEKELFTRRGVRGSPSLQAERGLGGEVVILRVYTYPALHRSFLHRIFSFLSFMISSFVTGLRVRDVDLVWGTSPPIFQGVTTWALARLKRASYLFEVRDLWPAFAVAVGVLRQPLLIRTSEWLELFLYRHADQVMVNSPGFIDHVKSRGARRVLLIPNGADSGAFDPHATGASFRDRHDLDTKFVALYAGAHGLSNDLGVLLDAADRLRDHPEIAIVLLGDGKEKAVLKARAAEMGLSNVHFLPPVPKNEMGEALAAANVCIGILKPIPLYATVYPNKVFDYMASGRPIVLAMEGVIRKVVEDAEAGIPVPPGNAISLANAIRTLAVDPEQRRALGLAGRAYVEAHFDRGELAKELSRVMEAMVEKNARG